MKVAIIGYGYLGKAYHKMFPNAVVYDEPVKLCTSSRGFPAGIASEPGGTELKWHEKSPFAADDKLWLLDARTTVNDCDIALVAVPTDPLPDGSLDMSIIEEVVGWLETPTILIKSALMPGTVDRLVKETGKKIAVSVELIGMGNYYADPSKYPDPKDPQKHQTIIVGGERETAEKCAEVLWDKMSPTVRIHIVSALEAEITKLVENAYPALKVTFINSLYNLAKKSNASFLNIHQAWTSDGRVDGFHQRTVSFKRGWKSHCWDKDIPALIHYAQDVGARDIQKLFKTVIDLNKEHLSGNDPS